MQVDSRRAHRLRWVVVVLAVCVFMLALRAKLSLYDPPHVGSVNPASVSKLWVSGDKVKTAAPTPLPLLWLTALLSFLPPSRRILRLNYNNPSAPRHLTMRELYRFLRPPPAF